MFLSINLRQTHLMHIWVATIFFFSGLLINFVQLANTIFLWPISVQLYRRINCHLNYTIWSQLVFIAEWWSGSELRVYADPLTIKSLSTEKGLVISNHTYEVDWIMGWVLADRCELLGNCKAFAKKMIQYLPVIGWGWYFSEFVFLERKWKEDQTLIRQQLSKVAEYKDPLWVLLYCEGTRFTAEKHIQSMVVAREKGLPELKRHLLPRTKGFFLSVRQLKGNVPAVYDFNFGFNRQEGAAPTLMNILQGKKNICEVYIRRFNLADVPEEEELCNQWLHKLYQEKDRILDSYIRTGSFSEESGFPSWSVTRPARRCWSLVNTIGWTTIIVTLLLYYIFRLVTSGSWIIFGSALLMIASGYLGLRKMIGLTSVTKSSSYGSGSNGTL